MKTAAAKPAPTPVKIAGVKKIVAVASGKGGVGKSTVATNLAAACQMSGLRTGLLDADIYGPSLTKILGITQKPQLTEDKKLIPVMAHDLQTMSIALIMGEERAMLWRGPMVMGAVRQMLFDVAWDNLDVLFIDLPPGTGDAQLTLIQSAIVDGAVIVSTPQDLALIDARRGLEMFRRMNVPILGIIENMSVFTCSGCGSEFEIFGAGGAKDEAEKIGVPFLGALPLDPDIRAASDAGHVYMNSHAESRAALLYREIAEKLIETILS
ncbi:MAG: Mrp/NBP35 family ATP-binding protein [Pseudomonadota bacterium]